MADGLPTFLAAPHTFRINSGGEAVVTITNKESKAITFKVKTTTPTRYVVRPRIGTVAGNSHILVTITHRPSSSGETPTPPGLSLLRDRFKVEAILLPTGTPETDDGISKVWAAKPKSKEIELQCEVVLQPPSGSVAADQKPEQVTSVNRSPLLAKPTPVVASIAQEVAPTNTTNATNVSAQDSSTDDKRVQRLKESEDQLRHRVAVLEHELKGERVKLEDALVTARAKEREVQALSAKAGKGVAVPLRLVIALVVFTFFISYYLGSR